MNKSELKHIAENLIKTTELAGKKSIELYKKGLKKIIKPDNPPVTNGDLEVNKILTDKIKVDSDPELLGSSCFVKSWKTKTIIISKGFKKADTAINPKIFLELIKGFFIKGSPH